MPDDPEPTQGSRGFPLTRRQGLLVLGVVVAVVAGAVVLAWPRGAASAASDTGTISVNHSGCGEGWVTATGGAQTLTLADTDTVAGEADLVEVGGANDGKVYGELEGMGPDTTDTMHVVLGPGDYAIRCVMDDYDPVVGPTVRIGGHAVSNPGVVPVTSTDLLAPLKAYQTFIVHGVATLVAQTDTLDAAVKSGNIAAAQADWLPAHLTYETLGAAYDAFGDYDGEINGTTAGLPDGVADPGFTGFHRVEYGLWHGEAIGSLTAATNQLDGFVHGLQHDLPTLQPQPLDIGLRAHEIMENTLQFELTGQTDYGSHTNLATADANATGDREVLGVLKPLLVSRYPQLSDVYFWLNRFQGLVDAQHHGSTWTPLDQLSQATREQLDGALSELVEQLAPIAAITEPRRTG